VAQTRSRQRWAVIATALILVLILPACAGGATPSSVSSSIPSEIGTSSARPSATALPMPDGLPRISLPVEPGSTVEGLVAVDGHDLYARCAGDGSPTVIYFTGWAHDRSDRAVAIAPFLERALGQGFRVCSYERRNTGRSATVGATQSPEDVISDVDGFLARSGLQGSFCSTRRRAWSTTSTSSRVSSACAWKPIARPMRGIR
jgi:hypothetical protein